jgi:2-methylcitrate dehydratase PrpD
VNPYSEGTTGRLAAFVENFSFEQLPQPVVLQAKRVLLDGIGCLLAATSSRFDIGSVVERFVRETGGKPEAAVFGTSLRTNCATAALVNGIFGYYCDIESHHAGAIMHAFAVVGPAALAVGERFGRSGRDVLAAFVLGVDVACRVSYALSGPALYARGFHPTCVAGTFGSVAAASKLFGLEGSSLLHAFGLAGTEASGLLAWVSDPTEHSRPYNMGLASRHGVMAAHLASCGFGGPPAIFEGKYPVGQAFTGQWNEAVLWEGLGEKFRIMELYFKLYACCAFIHPALDGLLDIMQAEQLAADDLERITLRFPKSGYKVIDSNALRSHCAQYVLALAAHSRRVDFYDILHDQRSDPSIRSLSERISVIGDEEMDRTYPDLYRSVVRIETRRSQTFERDVVHPKGSPESPLSEAELKEKFASLTTEVCSAPRRKAIFDLVDHLEEVEDISALVRLLASETTRTD